MYLLQGPLRSLQQQPLRDPHAAGDGQSSPCSAPSSSTMPGCKFLEGPLTPPRHAPGRHSVTGSHRAAGMPLLLTVASTASSKTGAPRTASTGSTVALGRFHLITLLSAVIPISQRGEAEIKQQSRGLQGMSLAAPGKSWLFWESLFRSPEPLLLFLPTK